jgi:hypothetical protein
MSLFGASRMAAGLTCIAGVWLSSCRPPANTQNLRSQSASTLSESAVNSLTFCSSAWFDERWGKGFFAPYVDVTLRGDGRDAGLYVLAFINSGGGEPGWGGESLARFHSRNGSGASQLASAYARVVNTLKLGIVDFDIEGKSLEDVAANELHSNALVELQKKYPKLRIWYTLPVFPQGLTPKVKSMWSLGRDRAAEGERLGGVSPTHSGLDASTGTFREFFQRMAFKLPKPEAA